MCPEGPAKPFGVTFNYIYGKKQNRLCSSALKMLAANAKYNIHLRPHKTAFVCVASFGQF